MTQVVKIHRSDRESKK